MGQVPATATQQLQANPPAFLEDRVLGDIGLAAATAVVGALPRQVQAGVDQRPAAWRRVGQEKADLMVLDLAQAAAPLARDAARVPPLLGRAVVIQDQDGLRVAQFLTDVAAEFRADGGVVSPAGADEVLQGSAFLPGLGGNRLGGLAPQAAAFAAEDGVGMAALLVAVEAEEVALDEAGQVTGAGTNVVRGDVGLIEKGLRLRVFQKGRHEDAPSPPEGYVNPGCAAGQAKLAQ